MPTYTVEITEIVEHSITLEALSPADAQAEALEIRGLDTESNLPEVLTIDVTLAESELVR